jgi:alkanesulfonate monooxygenase SsuD/methylene tetrahydromethanopterin reductase-like flavin-dependent oxidoreductase (luciferase family)
MLSRNRDRRKRRMRRSRICNTRLSTLISRLPVGREPRIMASRTLFVADDRTEALRFADIGLRRVVDHFVSVGHIVPGRSLPELIAAFDVHVGSPDNAIASLRDDSTLARVTDLVFQVHSVDPPHSYILRSIELTAKYVAPALGWEGPKAGKANRVALAN